MLGFVKSTFCWKLDSSLPSTRLLMGFPGGTVVKNPPANAGDVGDVSLIPGLGRSLEEEMTAHSSILTWRVPWTEEPGRLQSMGLQELDMTYQLNHHTYGSHCLQYSHSFFHVTHTYISIWFQSGDFWNCCSRGFRSSLISYFTCERTFKNFFPHKKWDTKSDDFFHFQYQNEILLSYIKEY